MIESLPTLKVCGYLPNIVAMFLGYAVLDFP